MKRYRIHRLALIDRVRQWQRRVSLLGMDLMDGHLLTEAPPRCHRISALYHALNAACDSIEHGTTAQALDGYTIADEVYGDLVALLALVLVDRDTSVH